MDRLFLRADIVIREDTDNRATANRVCHFNTNTLNRLLQILFRRIVVKGKFRDWELLKFIAL